MSLPISRIVVCLIAALALQTAVASAETAPTTDKPLSAEEQKQIVLAMVQDSFSDPSERRLMTKIADCESTLRHYEPSGDDLLQNTTGSSARGAFQVLMRVHGPEMLKLGLDPDQREDYMTYVKLLKDLQGTKPWDASKRCWARG